MEPQAIERYEYFKRLDAVLGLLVAAMDTGASTPEELSVHMPVLLAPADPYHASLVGQVQPEAIEAMLKPKNKAGIRAFAVAFKDYIAKISRLIDEGKPIIGIFPTIPSEILLSMDTAAYGMEIFTLLMAPIFINGAEKELDDTETDGIPSHVCAFQKGVYKAIEWGGLPKPILFIKGSAPCDSSNMTMQYASDKMGVPLHVVDSPYYTDQRAFSYYVDEMKRMVEAVERLTRHSIDEDALRQHVEYSNRQLKYYYQLQEIRKNKPNPDPGMHRPLDTASLYLAGSTDKFGDYVKVLYEEALARHEKKETFLPEGKQEIRTLWTGSFVPYMLYLADWLEDQFGSTFLTCSLTNLPGEVVGLVDTKSTETMIEGLAWRSFNLPMHRNVMSFTDLHVNDMLTAARVYAADAAIFSGNSSCKHAWTLPKIMGDVLLEKYGVPSLQMEVDWLDKRFTPPQTVKNAISEFLRLLV
ncbi:MAG: 2-hydroxyacyl-CoA dehydratase family protein [Desulfobacterales bacterium]|nr:2-hydroxyacyl-CoA dehydratase family protein [Desulfobacterales bacterium]